MIMEDLDFRIFDQENNDYIDSNQYIFIMKNKDKINIGKAHSKNQNNNLSFISNEKLIIEFWTGFTDIEGKKIFENDLIDISGIVYSRLVKFKKGDYLLIPSLKHYVSLISKEKIKEQYFKSIMPLKRLENFERLKGIKIIGNIHQNKDLFENF